MKNCTINLRQLIQVEGDGMLCWGRRKKSSSSSEFRVQMLHISGSEHTKKVPVGTRRRANKCLLCKQIIFKLFHQKFPLHWLLFSVFFPPLAAVFSSNSTSPLCNRPLWFPNRFPAVPFKSEAEVKKMHIDDFNLCKTHYSVVYDHNFSQFIKQVAPLKNQFEYQHKMHNFLPSYPATPLDLNSERARGMVTVFLILLEHDESGNSDSECSWNISIMQNCIPIRYSL